MPVFSEVKGIGRRDGRGADVAAVLAGSDGARPDRGKSRKPDYSAVRGRHEHCGLATGERCQLRWSGGLVSGLWDVMKAPGVRGVTETEFVAVL